MKILTWNLGEGDGDGRVGEEVLVADFCELLLLDFDVAEHLPDFGRGQDDPRVVLPGDAVAVIADCADLTWIKVKL